jgi:hypothetical protein
MSTSSPNPSEAAEVEAIARDYGEGWYAGDVARMERALHSGLVKRIPGDDGEMRAVSKARMVEMTGEGGGDMPDADIEVIVDDVSTDIASARVWSPEYLDYLHLVKTPDGWKIANVLFHTRD